MLLENFGSNSGERSLCFPTRVGKQPKTYVAPLDKETRLITNLNADCRDYREYAMHRGSTSQEFSQKLESANNNNLPIDF